MESDVSHPDVPLKAIWRVLERSSDGIAFVNPTDGLIHWHNAAFQAACGVDHPLRGTSLTSLFADWTEWPLDRTSGESVRMIYDPKVTMVLVRSTSFAPTAESRDPLTGLADRRRLEQRLHWLWAQSQSPHARHLAAMFIDLNDFKRINDDWGHQIGDEALRQVARRLQSALRADDLIARYGGDEFVVLLTGWQQPDDLRPLIQRVHESLKAPLELGGHSVVVSASIGLAYSTDGHASPETLLHAADRAMYASKPAL